MTAASGTTYGNTADDLATVSFSDDLAAIARRVGVSEEVVSDLALASINAATLREYLSGAATPANVVVARIVRKLRNAAAYA